MSQFWGRLKQVGPALVLAAVVLGPGSITLSTVSGSLYGYRLLWVPIAATFFMLCFTWMSARIGLATRQTIFQAARCKYGEKPTRAAGLLGFMSILAFQAGNSAAIGFSGQALFGLTVRFWAVLFFLFALAVIFLPQLYGKLELLTRIFVGLMMVTFFGTLALVGVEGEKMLAGLVPGFPDRAAVFLALGMASTTFSIAAAVYQSYLMKEKNWGPEQLATENLDSLLGIGILGAITTVVMLTSAAVIHGKAEPVFSAQGMAQQLEPLAGPAAFYLFTLGFFFASLSSLIVNPLIGATLLVDGFGKDPSMDRRPVKTWTVVALTAGLMVVLIFRGTPVELLRAAQAISVIAFPLLGFLVLSLAADRALMGEHANSRAVNLAGFLGYLTILGIVLNYLRQIFF